jgi:regulator of sirC expression with transglutaminase-like and TPR domain
LSVHKLQSLIKDWRESVVRNLEQNDVDNLAEYCLHLSRIVAYPNLDITRNLDKIDSMGREIKSSNKELISLRPTQIINTINNYLFKERQFRPNLQDYYNPTNSYLNIVLKQQIGIPITLSIIYMRVAHILNFKLNAVNFPFHFLIKHILEDDRNEIVIDPFNGGRIMDDYSLKQLLDRFYPSRDIPLTRAYLGTATVGQVIIRMLNNLKANFYGLRDINKVELTNEMILALEPNDADAVRDKGIIFLKRKIPHKALEMLSMYLELNPEAADADSVLDKIRKVRAEIRNSKICKN